MASELLCKFTHKACPKVLFLAINDVDLIRGRFNGWIDGIE